MRLTWGLWLTDVHRLFYDFRLLHQTLQTENEILLFGGSLMSIRKSSALLMPCTVLIFVAPLVPRVCASTHVQEGEMAGYLLIPHERVPETYNGGFSMYVAAWPLLKEYPGNRFQTGLPGTWMHAQNDRPSPIERMYSDIEGGFGLVA
jgi:hypothetical protein